MSKFGSLPEVVKYTEFGKEHLAFPIASRDLEHHLGENGEPLLSLVFVKPVVLDECVRCHFPEHAHGKPFATDAKSVPCGTFVAPQSNRVLRAEDFVQIVHDVAHESHKFTEEQIKARQESGLSLYPGNQIPGGRWRELTSNELDDLSWAAEKREKVIADAKEEKQAIADKAKADADAAAAKSAEDAKAAGEKAKQDEIDREAKIRNRQEELKTKAELPAQPPTKPEPPAGEPTGSVN